MGSESQLLVIGYETVAPLDGGWKAVWKGGCCCVGGRLGARYAKGIVEAGMFEEEVDWREACLYQERCGGCGPEGPKNPVCSGVPYCPYRA